MKRVVSRLSRWESHLVNEYFAEYGTRIAFLTYAFVFFYYGFLKIQAPLTGLATPVRGEVGHFVRMLGLPELGISLAIVMIFIGFYEMSLGTLFAFKKLHLAFPLFLIHQTTTFVSLGVARAFYFQEPFLFGVPWLFDTFAAYILKNLVFVGGFLVLMTVELGDRDPRPATRKHEREAKN